MAQDDEIQALAGEYVLGTLTAAERMEAQAEMARDAAFAAAVELWNGRLSALLAATRAIKPPAHLRERILARIASSGAGAPTVVDLRRQVTLWRGVSFVASALAAALIAFIVLKPTQELGPSNYVAVLQPDGPGPAFVASIDLKDGTISVKRVGAEPAAGKSYELWAVGGGRDKPQSLGVIDASLKIPASQLGKIDTAVLDETVFAISLEPEGGSPTGQATGPILYTGKLVATE